MDNNGKSVLLKYVIPSQELQARVHVLDSKPEASSVSSTDSTAAAPAPSSADCISVELTFKGKVSFPDDWVPVLTTVMENFTRLTVESTIKCASADNAVIVTMDGSADLAALKKTSSFFSKLSKHNESFKVMYVDPDKDLQAGVRVLKTPASLLPTGLTHTTVTLPSPVVARFFNHNKDFFNKLQDELKQLDATMQAVVERSVIQCQHQAFTDRQQIFSCVNAFIDRHVTITKIVLPDHHPESKEARKKIAQLKSQAAAFGVSYFIAMAGYDDTKFVLSGVSSDFIKTKKAAVAQGSGLQIHHIEPISDSESLVSVKFGSDLEQAKKVVSQLCSVTKMIWMDGHPIPVKRYLSPDTIITLVWSKANLNAIAFCKDIENSCNLPIPFLPI